MDLWLVLDTHRRRYLLRLQGPYQLKHLHAYCADIPSCDCVNSTLSLSSWVSSCLG